MLFPPELRLAGFFAVDLLAAPALFAAVELLFDVADFERLAVERFAPELVLLAVELAVAPASMLHFPLITRCAASATASAISEPSLVALATIDLAARSVVSAASMPASLIALRAFGLALIAAAAAASPAASISLLMATSAIFSVVDLPELDDFDPVLLVDFAIANLLRSPV